MEALLSSVVVDKNSLPGLLHTVSISDCNIDYQCIGLFEYNIEVNFGTLNEDQIANRSCRVSLTFALINLDFCTILDIL